MTNSKARNLNPNNLQLRKPKIIYPMVWELKNANEQCKRTYLDYVYARKWGKQMQCMIWKQENAVPEVEVTLGITQSA